ncbi:MAG: DUF2214 family protein [Cellvibrionaceae bacterium]|nr:DUF2214 family protein [Cellvibrionaceae bacterium]
MSEILIRYFHFIGIITLSCTLVAQNILIKPQLDGPTLKKIGRFDAIYGIAAVVTLVAGMLLWLSVGKPKEFYTSNPLFHIKVTLFIIVALLSAAPTIFFFKHRRNPPTSLSVPKHIRILKHSEMLFLIILPLLAVFIAKGIGI